MCAYNPTNKNLTATGQVVDKNGLLRRAIVTSTGSAGSAIFRQGGGSGTILCTLKVLAGGSFQAELWQEFVDDLYVTLANADVYVEYE